MDLPHLLRDRSRLACPRRKSDAQQEPGHSSLREFPVNKSLLESVRGKPDGIVNTELPHDLLEMPSNRVCRHAKCS